MFPARRIYDHYNGYDQRLRILGKQTDKKNDRDGETVHEEFEPGQ